MSSGEDSESAEWEREQMQRGTQSRGQKYHQPRTERSTHAIDVAAAKSFINMNIEKARISLESLNKSIGVTRLEIVKTEKKAESLRNLIEKQESFREIFKELGTLNTLDEVEVFMEKYRTRISEMSHDQRELIDEMEKMVKERQVVMETD